MAGLSIQLNVEALQRLIGSDPDVELRLKQAAVEELYKRIVTPVTDADARWLINEGETMLKKTSETLHKQMIVDTAKFKSEVENMVKEIRRQTLIEVIDVLRLAGLNCDAHTGKFSLSPDFKRKIELEVESLVLRTLRDRCNGLIPAPILDEKLCEMGIDTMEEEHRKLQDEEDKRLDFLREKVAEMTKPEEKPEDPFDIPF